MRIIINQTGISKQTLFCQNILKKLDYEIVNTIGFQKNEVGLKIVVVQLKQIKNVYSHYIETIDSSQPIFIFQY